MAFEFDPEKSKSNQKKHGIYFEDAQKLWDDPNRLVIAAKNIDEQRFLLIGKLENQYWSAIYTVRDDGAT